MACRSSCRRVAKEDQTAAEEQRLYESRSNELETTEIDCAAAVVTAAAGARRGARDQAAKAHDFASKELAVTKPLIASGAVSEVELLRLERDVARFRGERDMAAAQISRIQAAIAEAGHKLDEVTLAFRNEANRSSPKRWPSSTAFRRAVSVWKTRSPVRCCVRRSRVPSASADQYRRRVVQPGKDVVEVVPLEDSLLLSACPAARHRLPESRAEGRRKIHGLRFLHLRRTGRPEHIGADTVVDEEMLSTWFGCVPCPSWVTTSR